MIWFAIKFTLSSDSKTSFVSINLSLKEIGKEFEGRDHTTVMHSIDRIEKLTKTNPEIAEVIKDINANINARYE